MSTTKRLHIKLDGKRLSVTFYTNDRLKKKSPYLIVRYENKEVRLASTGQSTLDARAIFYFAKTTPGNPVKNILNISNKHLTFFLQVLRPENCKIFDGAISR